MCKVGSVEYLGKDTSGLGLTGIVVHPLLEFSRIEEFTELVFTVRTIPVFRIKRCVFESEGVNKREKDCMERESCGCVGWRGGEGKQRWRGEGSGKAREAFKGKEGRGGYRNVLEVIIGQVKKNY